MCVADQRRAERNRVGMDVAVLVLEGVADSGERPTTRTPDSLIGKACTVIARSVVEGIVERTARIGESIGVRAQVVVLEAGDGVLPRGGPIDCERCASQEIVLMGRLVRV